MKRPGDDRASLWDMREAAIEAEEAISGISLEGFLEDPIRIRALERLLEIIGEATNRVSPSFRDANPEIPWGKIIGLRHLLAHEYEEIDWKRLFKVAREDLPVLTAFLDRLDLEPSLRRTLAPKN